jgi:hypothetical protein
MQIQVRILYQIQKFPQIKFKIIKIRNWKIQVQKRKRKKMKVKRMMQKYCALERELLSASYTILCIHPSSPSYNYQYLTSRKQHKTSQN